MAKAKKLKTLSELFTWIAEKELPRRNSSPYEKPYMCWAAEDAHLRGLVTAELAAEAKRILTGRLSPQTTYTTWLAVHHPRSRERKGCDFHGRVAWARALAEEFRE